MAAASRCARPVPRHRRRRRSPHRSVHPLPGTTTRGLPGHATAACARPCMRRDEA